VKRSIWTGILCAVLLSVISAPAMGLRFMTYNILNYSSGRTAEFQAILAESDPELLVVQEILSQSAVDIFLSQVLNYNNPGEWAAGPFHNGYDTDNAIFYRTASVQFISHEIITTQLREIDEWTVRPVGYESESTNLRLYVVHLKASSGSTNEAKRLAEVQAMRVRMETFPAGQNYVVTGDFNIYDSYESAYSYMLGNAGGSHGVVADPLNSPGNWHNTSSFAWLHTQSPRTTQFGGGATGGMDDRFDMILTSPALLDGEGFEILTGTYKAFGNDGNHFDDAITDPPTNPDIPAAVTQALHDGSDHLPVIVQFSLPPILALDADLALGSVITGGDLSAEFHVENAAVYPADDLVYTFSPVTGFLVPDDEYEAEAESGPNDHTVEVTATAPGVYSGEILIENDSPDTPEVELPVSATVLGHGAPSVSAASEILAGAIDFGDHIAAEFVDQTAVVHNFDYNSLQAVVDVYSAAITGDARFTFTGGFTAESAGAAPAQWQIHFDASGATDGVYTAELTFQARDQQDLPGASALNQVVYQLEAEVTSGSSDVEDQPLPLTTMFKSIAPNPFSETIQMRFDLHQNQHTRLAVFDLTGRLVRTLVDSELSAGTHSYRWDGRDEEGTQLGSGIYFARIRTAQLDEKQLIIRLK
jgi:FlgD Ig-like domain/Endonuclease/Exonuclease/phosphatase family